MAVAERDARAHLEGKDDALVQVEPMLSMVGDWVGYLEQGVDDAERSALHRHARTGRPLGSADFIAMLERNLGRFLRKRKTGPRGPRNTSKQDRDDN